MNSDGFDHMEETRSATGTAEDQPAAPAGAKDPNRADPRRELITQAFVAIPPLTSRVYEVREVSRGGIFLAFKEPVTTLLEMEKADIGVGADADVAFAASVDDQRHRFNVRARIARVTREGIGLQFLTRNPPQLGALRDLFSRRSDPGGDESSQPEPASRRRQRQAIAKPADDAGWQDWELLD